MYFLIFIVFALISMAVGAQLKRKFREFSQVPTSSGLSGAQIAARMLRDNNIYDVEITSVPGKLTDHYNPANKTINLSEEVYHGRHVAAAAVAAHETGHAVQHATAYSMLQLRSKLVPIANIGTNIMNYVMMASLLFWGAFQLFSFDIALYIIIGAQASITLFTLVTLPVEFDASNRALVWLNASRITQGEEYRKAKSALSWAASTYVVAALAAVANLLYWVLLLLGNRD
ncbi:MAG: zinc metallopeptidase [Salibacteraceae bacterium]